MEGAQSLTTTELPMEQQAADILAILPTDHQVLADLATETLAEHKSLKEVAKQSFSGLQAGDSELLTDSAADLESTVQQAANLFSEEEIPVPRTVVSNSFPASPLPSARFERAEIDTTSPFESVKEAVTLFGGRMEWKLPHQRTPSMEKQSTSEADLQKARDDLIHFKEQLVDTKKSTVEILGELDETRKLVQELAGRMESQISREQVLASRSSLESAHGEVKAEIQAVREEIDSVRMDLCSYADAKQMTEKQSINLMATWDTISKRIEELTAELAAANEALTAAHVAHVDAEEQIPALRAEMEANAESIARKTGQKLEIMGYNLNSLEASLEEASSTAAKLKAELDGIVESQRKAAVSAAETDSSLVRVKLELEQAKSAESEAVIALGRVCTEIDEAKANLKHLSDENFRLSSKVELLRLQLDKEKAELERARECEGSACATLASLQAELAKVREELASAVSGEAKAREMMYTLPNAIKLTASHADESNAAAETFKEEFRKARHEAEEARAATSTAESRLQAALKEAEAAKVSEAMAIAEFKAVTGSEAKATVSVSEMDTDAGLIISLEEYSSLNQTAQEAEDVIRKQVAAAFELVDEAKASQLEAQKRLETVSKEIELSKRVMEEALKKADEALSAKLAAEGELRRWRAEHEQRRKAANIPSAATAAAVVVAESPQSKIDSGKELSKFGLLPSIQERKMLQLDSFAQVLSLKVPAPENPGKVLPVEDLPKERTKKITLLARMASYVMRKKNQASK